MAWFRDDYLRDARDIEDWRASPLRAGSLAGVAPAYVDRPLDDPLCDEAVNYARRLQQKAYPSPIGTSRTRCYGDVSMGGMIPAATATIVAALSHWPTRIEEARRMTELTAKAAERARSAGSSRRPGWAMAPCA